MPAFSVVRALRALGWVLPAQLMVTWFLPPVAWGSRKIFPGDVFSFVWIGLGLLYWLGSRDIPGTRWLVRRAILTAILCAVVVMHGAYRPTFDSALSALDPLQAYRDQFDLGREAVIGLRFWFWWMGAEWVAAVFSAAREYPFERRQVLSKISWTTLFCLGVAGLAAVGAKLSPLVRGELGQFYGYIPGAYPWIGRLSGIFAAPPEAGVTLGLAGVLLVGDSRLPRLLRILAALAASAGIAVSKTITALTLGLPLMAVGSGVGASAPGVPPSPVRRRNRALALVLSLVIVVGVVFVIWLRDPVFVHLKFNNLMSRTIPWRLYLSHGFERLDLVLLGMGMAPYHVDNQALFLFNRGGLLLLVLALWRIGSACARSWPNWNAGDRCAVVYLAVSCLTFDALILRPVVALVLVSLIPRLMSTPESEGCGAKL